MRFIFAWFGRRWSGANKPLLVVQMAVVMVAAFALRGCWQQPIETQETAEAVTSSPRIDPQDFLCKLSGGPAGTTRTAPLAGRRHTQAERLAARQTISVALRTLGLQPTEQRYAWSGTDSLYVSEQYLTDGCGGYGVNLFATLRATRESDRWIVIGAHYDTAETSPGADDNASGVTAVLLVAEELVRLPVRNANVVFAFFDQEEIGLVGSAHFVSAWDRRNHRIVGAHMIDMIGWDGDRDRTVEITHCALIRAPDASLAELYGRAARTLSGSGRGLSVGPVVQRDSCRSDHVSFLEGGYPAVHIAEEFSGNDECPSYHQPADTCDTLDYGYLRAVAALVAAAVTDQVR